MQRIPRPAQYLLRVDDLCPTLALDRWWTVRELIRNFEIRPILAVIPDNRDPILKTSSPDRGFWEEMRTMQSEGATIALHGFQHLCTVRAESLVPLHCESEFAGRSLDVQRNRIRSGIGLLQANGLTPRLFVAPNHCFDRTTLKALCDEGLPYLSDGFARVPFLREGVTWIPQQLWSPLSRRKGLWTICIHPDSTDARRLGGLKRFLKKFRGQFTSFDEVIKGFPAEPLNFRERLHEKLSQWRVVSHVRRQRKRV